MPKQIYFKNSLIYVAANLHDDTKAIIAYKEQLLNLVKKEFYKRNIDKYDYERFINILTCLSLLTDDMRYKINDFIERESRKHVFIDVRI